MIFLVSFCFCLFFPKKCNTFIIRLSSHQYKRTAAPIPHVLGKQQWTYQQQYWLLCHPQAFKGSARENRGYRWIYSCLNVSTQGRNADREKVEFGQLYLSPWVVLFYTDSRLGHMTCFGQRGQQQARRKQRLTKCLCTGACASSLFLGTLWCDHYYINKPGLAW